MENKKGTTVLLTVIGIATLLVAVVGATFAYFTASVTNTGSTDTNVTIQTATLGNVTFDQGAVVALAAENAYPNARTSKRFSVQATAGTVDYNYSVYMDVTSTFDAYPGQTGTSLTNMQYQLCKVETGVNECSAASEEDSAWTSIATPASKITLVNNELMEVNETEAVVHDYVLFVRLKETNGAEWTDEQGQTRKDQNYDQGKSFTGVLSVEVANLDGNTGYTTNEDGEQVTTNVANN